MKHQTIRLTVSALPQGAANLLPVLLGANAPLWLLGDETVLLGGKLVAIAGAREITPAQAARTVEVVTELVRGGSVIVTGMARGTDRAAVNAALAAGGSAVGVLAMGLETEDAKKLIATYRKPLDEGRILFISPFKPDELWSARNAMFRNRLVFGLADALYVGVCGISTPDKASGTWECALGAHKAGVPIFTFTDEGEGNKALLSRGIAKPYGFSPTEREVKKMKEGIEMRRAFFDGSSLGNPGHAGAACVLVENDVIVEERSSYLGEMTNNQAEYRAAWGAVRLAHKRGWKKFQLVGDSQLVINQLKGEWGVKDDVLRNERDDILAFISKHSLEVEFVWVPREQNARANELAQAASAQGKSAQASNDSTKRSVEIEQSEPVVQASASPQAVEAKASEQAAVDAEVAEPLAAAAEVAEQSVSAEPASEAPNTEAPLSLEALAQIGAAMSEEEAAELDAEVDRAMKAMMEQELEEYEDMEDVQMAAEAIIEAVAGTADNEANTVLTQNAQTVAKRGSVVEMVVEVGDPVAYRAGYGLVVTGDLAVAIKNGQIVRMNLVDTRTHQSVNLRFDTRNLNMEAASEMFDYALVATNESFECKILEMLAFANRQQHEQGVYVEQVPSLFSMLAERFDKKACMQIWNKMRHLLRDARTFGIHGKGGVHPELSNSATVRDVKAGDVSTLVLDVEVGIGDRLLAQMARKLGMDFDGLSNLELAKLVAVAVNEDRVPMVLTRNPHTSVTLGFARVAKLYVVPNAYGIYFAPNLAKAFFGDFDGDLYFAFPSVRRMIEALKKIKEVKPLKSAQERSKEERQAIWKKVRDTFNARMEGIRQIEDETARKEALSALKAEIADEVAAMKAVEANGMTVQEALAMDDVVLPAEFANKPDQFRLDERVRLDYLVNPENTPGKKKLNTSVFNGILAVAGADARKYVGILHAAAVGLIGTLYKYLGDSTAQFVGDRLLEIFETLFDAGKETTKLGRLAHGLPFVRTLSEMLFAGSTAAYAQHMKRLAEEFAEFTNDPNDSVADALRQCAEIILKDEDGNERNAAIAKVTSRKVTYKVRQTKRGMDVVEEEIPDRVDTTATNALEGNVRRMVIDPDSFGEFLLNKRDHAEAINIFNESEVLRPPLRLAEELDLDPEALQAAVEEAYTHEAIYQPLGRALRYGRSKATGNPYRIEPKALEPTSDKEASRLDLRGARTAGRKWIEYKVDYIKDVNYIMVVDEALMDHDTITRLQDIVVKLEKDGKARSKFSSLHAAITSGLIRSNHDRPAYVTVAVKKNGRFAIALYVQFQVQQPNGNLENRPTYDTVYMPVLVLDDVVITKRLMKDGDALVMAIKLTVDGKEFVVPGRIAARKRSIDVEDGFEGLGGPSVQFEPFYQDPFVAIAQYLLEAYRASSFYITDTEQVKTKDGKTVKRTVVKPVFAFRYEEFRRAIIRRLVQQLSWIHKIDGVEEEYKEQVGYASHFILIDETLLRLIRERIVGVVRIDEEKTKAVVLPFQPGLAFVGEGGVPGLDEVINEVISFDGNRRRIYLPLKKDGSRILWFDPADRAELTEMCIPVVDTNFRRQIREQLPFSTFWVYETVDGVGRRVREMEMNVLFANADFLTTGKKESVEGMFILRDLDILVTKVSVFKVQPDKSIEEQVRIVRDRAFPEARYLVDADGNIEDIDVVLADSTKVGRFVRVREETFDVGAGTFTHRSATVRFGYRGMPDMVKLMFGEGTIKGMASRAYGDLYAVLGDKRIKVDVIAPMAAIVEKNTGSILIYGLAQLLGRIDIIEQYESEILQIRQEFGEGVSDEGQEERKAREREARARAIAAIRHAAEAQGIANIEEADVVLAREDGEHNVGKGLVLRLHVRVLDSTSMTNGRAGYIGNSLLQREVLMLRRDALKEQLIKEDDPMRREAVREVYQFFKEMAYSMRPIKPVREQLVSQLESFIENVQEILQKVGSGGDGAIDPGLRWMTDDIYDVPDGAWGRWDDEY